MLKGLSRVEPEKETSTLTPLPVLHRRDPSYLSLSLVGNGDGMGRLTWLPAVPVVDVFVRSRRMFAMF